MFQIDDKNYDLNFLMRFDMLKEILMKLLKNQNSLQNELDLLKKSNKERDNKIINIEQIITELQEESSKNDIDIELKNEVELGDHKPIQKIQIEDKEMNGINKVDNKNDFIVESNNNNEYIQQTKIVNEQNGEESEASKKELNNESPKEEKKKEELEEKKDILINNEEKENIISDRTNKKSNIDLSEKSQTIFTPGKRSIRKKKSNMKDVELVALNNKEIISKMNLLEVKLNNIQSNHSLKNIRQELKNHDLENQSDFKVIETKFNDINQKLEDYDKKLEDCLVKLASIDILSIIQDNGDGTVDGAKILFKSLEDKCNKKFELIDARYKQEALTTQKMKQNVENIIPVFEKINRDIDHLKELEEQQKEEIENTKKNFETETENVNKTQKESEDELLKKISELGNNFDKKLEEIEIKVKSIKTGEVSPPLFNLGLNENDNEKNKVNEEQFQMLEKKVNDIRTKLNDLNNTMKIFSNEETQKIKNDVKELMLKIDTKIAKEDLKELYNMHLSDLDEINDLKDQMGLIVEEQKKLSKDLLQASSRLEMVNSNVIMLQNSQLNGGRGPVIDITRYIDQQKLSDTLKPIIKEIEKLYRELIGIQREFSEIKLFDKIFEKKERINRMEEDIYNKISEIESLNHRKFADKIDTNKALKALDLQIKDLAGDRKKSDGSDNWLMAKQPLKCFNCASCEANLKNNPPPQEYIPWNKYPQGERIYRMGQGFSHMLQMMTSEFVQTFDQHDKDKDLKENINLSIENDSNANSKNTNKVFTNLNTANNNIYNINEKSLISARINSNKDDFYRTGKLKLPKMKKFSKFVKEKFDDSIPVSDEEKDNFGNSIEKAIINTESPKIMKIVKKKAKNTFNSYNMGGITPKYGFSLDYGRKKNLKENFDLNMKDKILKKNEN